MIVGFGYNMGVGKDTAALALCRELGFKRIGFADALKSLAVKTDPLVTSRTATVNVGIGHGRLAHTVAGLGYDEAKRVYPEVRRFLQALGNGAREVLGDLIWINQVMDQAISRDHAGLHTVISDVRYQNEAEAIKAVGGLLINITRPGHHGDGHVTETELNGYDGWDHVIENNGTIAELDLTVVQLVRDALPRTYDDLGTGPIPSVQ